MTCELKHFQTWVDHMRMSIQAASIVRQYYDRLDRDEVPPNLEEMRAFAEEGGRLADLWQEMIDQPRLEDLGGMQSEVSR